MKKYNLFQLQCKCDVWYSPEENIKCPNCNADYGHQKELKLDINKFLTTISDLYQNGNEEDSLDIVFDVFWQLHARFDIMDEILTIADPKQLSSTLMVSLLTNTFKYSKQIPNHIIFFNKVTIEYMRRGKTIQEIQEILHGLEGAKNYWENMKTLGAPEFITGPKPKDR